MLRVLFLCIDQSRTLSDEMRSCFLFYIFLFVTNLCSGIDVAVDLTKLEWEIENQRFGIRFGTKIPIDIYEALFRDGRIPDPYIGMNDVTWRNMSELEWNFTTHFRVPSNFTELLLIADSVDTHSDVYLRNQKLGRTSNMFRQYVFDLSHLFGVTNDPQVVSHPSDDPVALRFEFRPSARIARQQAKWHAAKYNYSIPPDCPPHIQNGVCHVNMLRKMQSSFSWDWGPAFPTVGLYNNMQIRVFDHCTLVGFNVVPILNQEWNDWRLNVDFMTFCRKNATFLAKFSVKIDELGELEFSFNATLRQTLPGQYIKSTASYSIPDGKVERWYPNGCGAQKLYNAVGRLEINGQILGRLNSRLAFRSVELIQERIGAGLTFYFKINGVRTFLKGANWIPSDSFQSRITADRLLYYFESMKRANMNAIRVWGGGLYESDLFYDLADKYGIMIWHDMMFAVSLYPGNDVFLNNVKKEIVYQIDRLKRHPSIIVWAGNNENELGLSGGWFSMDAPAATYLRDYKALYWDTIYVSINSTDFGSRPYLTSSPSNGAYNKKPGGVDDEPNAKQFGDMHYYNYNMDLWDPNAYPKSRCVTEYGFQSFASFNTLSRWIGVDRSSYFDPMVTHRQHHLGGHEEILYQIWTNFRLPACCKKKPCKIDLQNSRSNEECYTKKIRAGSFFKEIVYLNQMFQALAYKAQTEHYRRWMTQLDDEKLGWTSCAMFWQLNDIWPGISWSSIDYDRVWKPVHYYARRFFAPLLISPILDDETESLSIFVVSDLTETLHNFTLVIDVHSMQRFDPISTKSIKLDQVKALESALVFRSPYRNSTLDGSDDLNTFVRATLLNSQGQTMAENVAYPPRAFITYPAASYGEVNIANVTLLSDWSDFDQSKRVFEIVVGATSPAPFVWLEAKNVTGWFSDNGFLAMTNESVVRFYSWSGEVTLDYFTERLSVVSLGSVLRAFDSE